MISVEQAFQLILAEVKDFGTESVSLEKATGKILREPLIADRDFPPFDRVTMDGIGILYSSFDQGQRNFPIEGIAAAGAPQQDLTVQQNCLEVMTGAITPKGIDTVIRYEDLTIKDKVATINIESIKEGQNIHKQGSDRAIGSTISNQYLKINTGTIGVAATIGKSTLKVSRQPKAIIISTGDELVDVHEQPLPHQIRKSNVYSIASILKSNGVHTQTDHLDDDLETIKEKLQVYLSQFDFIVLSGGVSKGKFDYLPQALEALGVEKKFHRVRQRPGKPFWFGKHPGGCLVFALPGNPVSTVACTVRYILPWLYESLQVDNIKETYAKLAAPIHFKPDLTYFAQVRLQHDKAGQLWATPVEGKGSGDLANLINADGFIEIPTGQIIFEKGEAFRVYWL